MDPLPPIPTPPSQRWREFRIQVLPVVIFAIVLLMVVVLWRSYVLPASIVGMVQTNTVSITSAKPGVITDLFVKPFDTVTNGQPLCIIQPFFNSEIASAALEKIAADLEVSRSRMAMTESGRAEGLAKMRLGLLEQQTLLAIAKVKLDASEKLLKAKAALFNDEIIGEIEFDAFKAARDSLQSEVTDRTRLVTTWDLDIAAIGSQQTNFAGNLDPIFERAIRAQQDQARAMYQPVVLKSPIDGQVGEVFQFPNQHSINRQPIMTINSTRVERIIAFIRQPISLHPKVGDQVTVRTRGNHRQQLPAVIIEVGVQLEPINPVMLPWSNSRRAVEMGLPVAIRMPPDLKLMPGELVELALVVKP